MTTSLYLASASPRRHELLKQIGIEHQVLALPTVPGEDEPRHPNESPLQYVQRTALDKAVRARQHLRPNSCAILAADTTVALGDLVLGKPADPQEAASILAQLSDQTHIVYTAVVLDWQDHHWQALSTSHVTFGKISAEEINAYIATGEPFGKAGAYGIQGHAARFIKRLEGSYSGVMGLPLYETAKLLKQLP